MAYYRNPSRSLSAKVSRFANRHRAFGFSGPSSNRKAARAVRSGNKAKAQYYGWNKARRVDAYWTGRSDMHRKMWDFNNRYDYAERNPSRSIAARERRGWSRGPNRKMYRARTSWDYKFPEGVHPSALSYPKYAWYSDSRLARISSRVNARGRR